MARKMLGEYKTQMLKFQTCLNAARNKMGSGHEQTGNTDEVLLTIKFPQRGMDVTDAISFTFSPLTK